MTLVDVIRRVGAQWTATIAYEAAEAAAIAAAPALGWDQARIAREVEFYHRYLARTHRVGPNGLLPAGVRDPLGS